MDVHSFTTSKCIDWKLYLEYANFQKYQRSKRKTF